MIPGFPPNLSSFALASPKVRETDSLPGVTRYGPTRMYSHSSGNLGGFEGNNPIFIHIGL